MLEDWVWYFASWIWFAIVYSSCLYFSKKYKYKIVFIISLTSVVIVVLNLLNIGNIPGYLFLIYIGLRRLFRKKKDTSNI